MKTKLQPLAAACLLMLVFAGCHKDDRVPSSTSAQSQVCQPETALQQPVAQLRVNDFPVTPKSPVFELSSSDAFIDKDDSNLATMFFTVSGTKWNQALMEMKKRQTPALISVMVKNLDEMRGIAVVSGEALYAPELCYPVVRVLIDCGDKPIGELVSVCTSPNFSLKKRLLAARVLRHLGTCGHPAAKVDQIRSTLGSSANLASFNELWAAAQDDSRVASVIGDP